MRFGRAGPFALAIAAGIAQALSIAWPWNGEPLWWLQLLSLIALCWLIQRSVNGKQAGALGWTFATSWLCGTFWWLFISMHTYGGLAAPFAGAAVLALAVFLASYYALASAAFAKLRCGKWWADALLLAALWTVAELLRVTLFTGFPWGEGGYAHVDGPLAVLAPVVGVHGIGFAAAFIAYLLSQLGLRQARRSIALWGVLAAAGALLAACHALSANTAPADRTAPISVALLQGNIPQDEKFEAGTGVALSLEWYGTQLQNSRAALVIAPETALPLLPTQLPDGYYEALAARFSRGGQAALVGMPLGSFREGYTNSVMGFRPQARAYRYDKHHLVPFGEFIPPLFKWFVRLMNIPLGDFNRGSLGQPSFDWQGQRIAPNVCYEDLFGEEIAKQFVDEAHAPTILANVSNIAWFGDTVAIDQHLQISRMRTIEFDRPMIRATNTGATAIIDRSGRVTAMLPRLTRGVLEGSVEGGGRLTPYAWWSSRTGLWPIWLLCLAVAGVAWWRPRAAEASPT